MFVGMRVTADEKQKLRVIAYRDGYSNVSSYIRDKLGFPIDRESVPEISEIHFDQVESENLLSNQGFILEELRRIRRMQRIIVSAMNISPPKDHEPIPEVFTGMEIEQDKFVRANGSHVNSDRPDGNNNKAPEGFSWSPSEK